MDSRTIGQLHRSQVLPIPTLLVPTPSGSSVQVHIRTTASDVHTVAHNLNRMPIVRVYTLGGEEVHADVLVTDTTATVRFVDSQSCIIIIG